MPEIGDTKITENVTSVWTECVDCGLEYWTKVYAKRPIDPRCEDCRYECPILHGVRRGLKNEGKYLTDKIERWFCLNCPLENCKEG